jgi:hypothetical protein
MRLLLLATVNSVVAGEHTKRKVWDYITVDLIEDEDLDLPSLEKDKLDNLHTAVRLGRKKVISIINSALGLMPNDHSEATEARREQVLASWENLNGLTYWAETKTRPASNGYEPSVAIDYIITPDLPDYPKSAGTGVATVATAQPRRTLADDMDDEINF